MAKHQAGKTDNRAAIDRLIEGLSNGDIYWDGTYVGLEPNIAGDAARQLLDAGDGAIAPLVAALSDPDRFVAAHVLLTYLTGVEYATLPWNGLNVDLGEDGTVLIDPAQRFDLQARWQAWRNATPPPATLPSG